MSHPVGSRCVFGGRDGIEAGVRNIGPCDDGLDCDIQGDGTCQPQGELNEPCGPSCQRGLLCDDRDICRAPPTEGQACVRFQCGVGHYCDDTTRQCHRARAAGEGCAEGLRCEVGLYCNGASVCEAALVSGAGCLIDAACQRGGVCNFGAGDGRSGICQKPSDVGGPCAWRSEYLVNAWYPKEHGCRPELTCVPDPVDPLQAGNAPLVLCGADRGCWFPGTCAAFASGEEGALCNDGDDCAVGFGCVERAAPYAADPHPGFDENLYWRGAWPGVCRGRNLGSLGAVCISGACQPDFYCSAMNDGVCMGANGVGEGGSCKTGDGDVDPKACALGLVCRLDDAGQATCLRP